MGWACMREREGEENARRGEARERVRVRGRGREVGDCNERTGCVGVWVVENVLFFNRAAPSQALAVSYAPPSDPKPASA